MILTELYWREPLWMLTLPLPFAIIAWRHYQQRRQLQQISSPALAPWVTTVVRQPRQILVWILFSISWFLFCLALTGPRTPHWIPPSLQTDGASLVIIVDLSASMNARDNRSDRRSQAQSLIQRWIKDSFSSINIGIVIFAGHAHTLLTPTSDHELIKYFLDQLENINVPTLGNNLAAALQLAVSQLQVRKRGADKRVLVSVAVKLSVASSYKIRPLFSHDYPP